MIILNDVSYIHIFHAVYICKTPCIHDHGPIMSALILALNKLNAADAKKSPCRTVQVPPRDNPDYDI